MTSNIQTTVPANLLKINAYKKIQKGGTNIENYNKAVEILRQKHLVYGEPAVVEFELDGKPELLFGIGTLDSSLYLHSKVLNGAGFIDASTGEVVYLDQIPEMLKEFAKEIERAEKKIDEFDEKIKTYDASIAKAVDDASLALSKVGVIDSKVSELSGRVDDIDSSLMSISEVIAAHAGRIDTIDGSIADIYEKLSRIPESIAEISDASIDGVIEEFCK